MTARLSGSLPRDVLSVLETEADRLNVELDAVDDEEARRHLAYRYQRELFGKWDRALGGQRCGPRWLQAPRIAKIVAESVQRRDGDIYTLLAYCIMPNHVHLVFRPHSGDDGKPLALSKIMQSLKGYTARACNEALGRDGAFWQHESYDHWVRDEAECARIVRYVMANPVEAGLVARWQDWPWVYVRDLP